MDASGSNVKSPRLTAALAWAEIGVPAFPCVLGTKEPATGHGFKDATVDPAVLQAQWAAGDRNVAISPGAADPPLFVIDLDGVEGEASWAALEAEHGKAPETWEQTTPHGGRQLVFEGEGPNTVRALGPGIDTRGVGGYVLVAPSFCDGHTNCSKGGHADVRHYRCVKSAQIAELPAWVLRKIGEKNRTRHAAPDDVELDLPPNVARARLFIRDTLAAAKGTIAEGTRNNTLHLVVCTLKDLGLSYEMTEALVTELLVPHVAGGFDVAEFAATFDSAYHNSQNEIGAKAQTKTGAEAFGPAVEKLAKAQAESEAKTRPALLIPLPLTLKDTDLSPRRWVLGKLAIRGLVTEIIAPPGVGKSATAQVIATALASGKSLLGDVFAVHDRCAVAGLHYEEDQDELYRRSLAACRHYELAPADLQIDGRPAVFLCGLTRDRRPYRLAEYAGDNVIATDAATQLARELIAAKAGVLIIDPLIKFHGINENNNADMDQVFTILGEIAMLADVAVIVLHHTNKPPQANAAGRQGDQNTARGASAQTGAARFVLTLYAMTEKEAKEYAIPAGTRWRYFRLDRAKGNYSEGRSEPTWFEFRSVKLATSDPDKAESVGVPVPAAIRRVRVAAGELLALGQAIVRAMDLMGREAVLEAPALEVARAIIQYVEPGSKLEPDTKRHRMQEALAEAPIRVGDWRIEYVPGKGRRAPAMVRRTQLTTDSDGDDGEDGDN